jgi:hypothetical protein
MGREFVYWEKKTVELKKKGGLSEPQSEMMVI